MSKQQNFYEVLNSTPNSTFDELKSNYKQLILQCHPDKLHLQQDKVKETLKTKIVADKDVVDDGATTVDPNNVNTVDDNAEFVMINKAWNTLKDPVKRKHYDAELLLTKFQMHSNIFEHLTLDDMSEHEDINEEEVDVCRELAENHTDKMEKNIVEDLTESESATTIHFYTYNCRCGGQYIIDESAAADNGIYKRSECHTNSNNDKKCMQQNTKAKDCDNVDDKDDVACTSNTDTVNANAEVMVECSECSLVIMLSNEKQKSKSTTDSTLS